MALLGGCGDAVRFDDFDIWTFVHRDPGTIRVSVLFVRPPAAGDGPCAVRGGAEITVSFGGATTMADRDGQADDCEIDFIFGDNWSAQQFGDDGGDGELLVSIDGAFDDEPEVRFRAALAGVSTPVAPTAPASRADGIEVAVMPPWLEPEDAFASRITTATTGACIDGVAANVWTVAPHGAAINLEPGGLDEHLISDEECTLTVRFDTSATYTVTGEVPSTPWAAVIDLDTSASTEIATTP